MGEFGQAGSGGVLIRGVGVFDTSRGTVGGPFQVLVAEGRIQAVAPAGEKLDLPAGTQVIDGADGTLIPGLIDAHWHAMLAAITLPEAATADPGLMHAVATEQARRTLLRGFTTVRDVGGPTFGLKAAIDSGRVLGPRIFPSGALISQTGGHGDLRDRADVPRGRRGRLSHLELLGVSRIADGVPAVLEAAREQLMLGATQLKLMAGGGVASSFDPIDVTQLTPEEIHAAVRAADNWGTYVTVHAYTPRSIRQSVEAGVRCIEHGQLIDESTAELLAHRGIWWSLQPFLDDRDRVPVPPSSEPKQQAMMTGTDRAYALAIKHGVKVAWGTDTLFDPRLADRQGAQLVKMTRWYTPAQVLTMATADNAELLAMSGERNPYPGRLGTVVEGALADLILVDGNPLDDLTLLERPQSAFRVILKDGCIVKDLTAA